MPAAKTVSPLRLMLWLKWTLTWRGYRRNTAKIVSVVFLILIFLPMSLGAAALVWFVCHARPALAPVVARDALAVIYLLWVTTPLLGFQLNEAYDLTKLFVYPLSYRQIFWGSVVGSLMDLPVLLVLPTVVVLLAVFASSPAAFFFGLVLLSLFLLHTLALGQAITLALVGFLRSRRFRDITIVLFPLIGMAYYIGQQTFIRQIGNSFDARILDGPVWRASGWLPPGWAASGLAAGTAGGWLTALGAAGGLAVIGALTLRAAAATLKNLYLGDSGPQAARVGTASAERPARRESRVETTNGLIARLPADIAAMVGKEWTYLRREPQYKALAVNSLYTLVVLAIAFLNPASAARRGAVWAALGDWRLLGLSGTLLLSSLPLIFNIWGGEGAAITVLFSLPTRRRAMLLGKNLAHAVILLGVNVIGLTLLAAATGGWGGLAMGLVWTILAVPVLLGAGNLMSIKFPHRMLVRGQRWSKGGVAAGGSDGSGCAYAFLYFFAFLGALLALLPTLAAVALPRLLGASPLWYALSLPLAALYAGAIYWLLLGQAEVWLMAREPEIAAKIVPPD